MTQSPQEKLAALAQRAIPFLRDEGAKYDDDGSNEPLELARDIEQALSEHGEVVVTTDESGRCVAVTRQDAEGRILSTIWEASEHGGGGEAVDLTDTERQTIEALLNLAYAAWCLADNTEDSGDEGLTIDRSDFAGLEKHLDTLDQLPDD